jgi:cyclophilin family peptidyl-prolyl cis-trans isomerase
MIRYLVCRAAIALAAVPFFISAAPVIDPIPNASIPAGKSLIIPVTATSTNGRPLTFTATSSTNRITVQVHTNNPFWKMSVVQVAPAATPGAYETPFRGGVVTVTNVGDMTFMLFHDIAPHAVDVIQGLTASGFYTSNTVFHRIVAGFMNQGGEPGTNGMGGAVFTYDNAFHPQAMFTGNGQLAMANPGKDADGSQFFVTVAPFRLGDFNYTICGQLVRGFSVLTNINNTPTNSSGRPLAEVIIAKASLVPDHSDTVLTLVGTNKAGVSGTIKVVADDGAGGRTTNSFTATTVTDTNLESAFLYPNAVTNLVAPVNKGVTNYIFGYDFPGVTNNWYVEFYDDNSYYNATNSQYNTITNQLVLMVRPNANYSGPISVIAYVSATASFARYDQQIYTFAFGDTVIKAVATNFIAPVFVPLSNQLVATFTNGVANSAVTNFTASINWGDNTTNSGVIMTNALRRKEVRGAHTYTNSGDYPVYVTIQSVLGASTTVVCTSTVPPSLSVTRVGTNNTVSWPAWAFAYQSFSNTNPLGTNWTAMTNLSRLLAYENVVTNSTTNRNLYFRLRK